jgi:hypothetical protein
MKTCISRCRKALSSKEIRNSVSNDTTPSGRLGRHKFWLIFPPPKALTYKCASLPKTRRSSCLGRCSAVWRLQRGRFWIPVTNRRSIFYDRRESRALLPPHSISWRGFKNPVSLFIGGVTAVIMELAEPRVRTGVWEHTTFRVDPIRRLRRTGLAAMVTVYGPRSTAEAVIAGVRRMHDRVAGTTTPGEAYRAAENLTVC